MFKRLVVLILLALATLSASQPALATTLTITYLNCYQNGGGNFACDVIASGGTGSYASYTWVVRLNNSSSYQRVTTEPELIATCWVDKSFGVTVTVQDSSGATASASTGGWCTREAQ
ncbi:MAG TPA: hypothetical protein VFZ66_02775 [Herpetosiphonaceae bacterium]